MRPVALICVVAVAAGCGGAPRASTPAPRHAPAYPQGGFRILSAGEPLFAPDDDGHIFVGDEMLTVLEGGTILREGRPWIRRQSSGRIVNHLGRQLAQLGEDGGLLIRSGGVVRIASDGHVRLEGAEHPQAESLRVEGLTPDNLPAVESLLAAVFYVAARDVELSLPPQD